MPQPPPQHDLTGPAGRPTQTAWLARLVHRRWSLHVLAEVHASGGAKLITLTSRTGATAAAAKASAQHLVDLGLLARPSGPGHPLRPEYALTPEGAGVAHAAVDVVAWIDRRGAADSMLRKWSLPTVWAMRDGPHRFGELRSGLPAITDRALSLSLNELRSTGLVDRRVIDVRPPASEYRLARRARSLAAPLAELVRAG